MRTIQKFDEKQPFEEFYLGFNFTKDLATEEVATAIISVVDGGGNDVTSSLTSVNLQSIQTPYVYFWIKGGENLKAYKITCKITTSLSASKYEQDAILTVVEK